MIDWGMLLGTAAGIVAILLFILAGEQVFKKLFKPGYEEYKLARQERQEQDDFTALLDVLAEDPETYKAMQENSAYLLRAYKHLSKQPEGQEQILKMIARKIRMNGEKQEKMYNSLKG